MQLVLGAQVEPQLGTAGAPLPAPPERWTPNERTRRALRRAAWVLAFAALAALGALHGATVAIGAHGVSELAGAAPAPARSGDARVEAELRGVFWRPDGSNAQRPPVELAPRRWSPERDAR
jgi:hypothetical protein